jgi:hypothetical protein
VPAIRCESHEVPEVSFVLAPWPQTSGRLANLLDPSDDSAQIDQSTPNRPVMLCSCVFT